MFSKLTNLELLVSKRDITTEVVIKSQTYLFNFNQMSVKFEDSYRKPTYQTAQKNYESRTI